MGAKIGNGDDAAANLYWGCSDGLGSYFKASKSWKVQESKTDPSPSILRELSLRHTNADIHLTAEAYRGSEMKACLQDFEKAAASGKYALVAFIGHNGLMDFPLDPPAVVAGNKTPVIVLCCLSDKYFTHRLRTLGCEPILMTQQLMYPGAFLLHAGIESWRKGGSTSEIREAAAAAYAKNQKISVKAARSIFAPLTPQ